MRSSSSGPVAERRRTCCLEYLISGTRLGLMAYVLLKRMYFHDTGVHMPSHILLLGHARMGQWADLPACLVDSGQCRPEVQELVCGGWAGSYARTRRGHVYSMQRAKYRAIDAPGSRPAAAVDLSADSRIALPAGERCMGCVLDRPPERRRCCALVPCS